MIKVGLQQLLVISITMQRQDSTGDESQKPIIRPSMTESEQIESMLNMNDISDIIPRQGNEELQAQVNRLEALLAEADKNVEMKDRQMEVLKKTCKTLENHTEMQKKRISFLEEKMRSLENQNKSLKEEKSGFESSIIAPSNSDLKGREEAERELAQFKERYEQKVAEMAEKERIIDGLKGEKEQLRRQKVRSEESLARLTSQNASKIDHHSELQNKVRQLEQQNRSLQSSLQEQSEASVPRKDYQVLQFRYNKMNTQVTNIKQQLESERKKISELEKKRKAIEKQLNESNTIRQTLKARCEALQAKQVSQNYDKNALPQPVNGKTEKQKSEEALLNPKEHKYSQILQSTKEYLATKIDCRQQKIRFLNTIILNAENQLEGLLSE